MNETTEAHALEPTADSAWVLYADGYDALRQSSLASRFASSNGFLGIRGERALARGANWGVPSHSYVAGLFDAPDAEGAMALVPVSGWLSAQILLPGGPMVHHPSDAASHRMSLDLKRGAVLSQFDASQSGSDGQPSVKLHVRTLRLVSLSDRAVLLHLARIEVEEGDVDVTIEVSVENPDFGLITERLERNIGVWRTHRSGKRLAIAADVAVHVDGKPLLPLPGDGLKGSWTWHCLSGQAITFRRIIAVARTDTMNEAVAGLARDALGRATQLGWRAVVAAHEAAWSKRWGHSDVTIEGDPAAQKALRFAIYHLNSAVNPDDPSVSVGARALTGDDYHGHVFWDTEIYLLPFYTMTWPEAARSLLMYRFRTLNGARAKAAGMGWRGALYAWESAATGEEMTPEHVIGPDREVIRVLCGVQEQHISADVAYAVWQYWQATADDAFMLEAGAEILLETARFWASRAVLEADGFGHIRSVIGPDEYHETIDDNAYTNVMAQWNIRRGLEIADLLRSRHPERWRSLSAGLKLDGTELEAWSHAADTITTGLDAKTGLYEQFAGFSTLEEIDLTLYTGRSVPMDVVLGRDRIARSQVVKQADVVALLGLLPEAFAEDTGLKNFRHYEPRCSHGSSLSRAMHGMVAARFGMTEMARNFFRDVASIDLGDTHVASDGGIHIAALGGNWMTAVFGFAGLSLVADGLALNPQLPPGWVSFAFQVQWRGRSISVRIGQTERVVDVTLIDGQSMTIVVWGEAHRLLAHPPLRLSLGDLPLQHS